MFSILIKKLKIKYSGNSLGLLPLPPDDRDLGFWNIFGEEDYQPKHEEKILKTISVKNQLFNTCGWASSTAMKEIDEGMPLSVRSLVILGKWLGYITGDGFSNLRDNQKTIQKYGIPEEGIIPETASNFDQYADTKLITQNFLDNAAKHKSDSFWRVYNTNEIYKLIDEERPVQIGVDWYSGLNMGGGFKSPWIWKIINWLVGGHAMFVKGYKQNYTGKKVFVIQNSFGNSYGDNGDMYILPADLQKQIDKYGAYANKDVPLELAKWLVQHQGKVVKTDTSADVFLIQGDKKRKYPDLATLYAHGRADSDIVNVPSEYLDKVKEGDVIDFWEGGNVKQIKLMIQQRENIKNIFKGYFEELLK